MATAASGSGAASGHPPQLPMNPQASLLRALLQVSHANDSEAGFSDALLTTETPTPMRKVWVKRRGASATIVTIPTDALVDDVRDLILRKYANSLGRHFDSPDLSLYITSRDRRQTRPLGPEEVLSSCLDAYYPDGQTVDEALIVDIPQQKTPRPSPRSTIPYPSGTSHLAVDSARPSEAGEGYFPPVAPLASSLTALPGATSDQEAHIPPTIAPGQVPSLPSPGNGRSRVLRERTERPRLGRSHTSSPTVQPNANTVSKSAVMDADQNSVMPTVNPHSTAPVPSEPTPTTQVPTPPARASSPRPIKKKIKKVVEKQKPPVPPINVLLVEDNPINLKLLEAFAKGLKVRWESAMNGRDAVTKWRSGGFHLVLMDIQLPVMNGLEATREIRRLERVNSIGVFSSPVGKEQGEEGGISEGDRLANIDMFKSPVIIVALTASSLQSDRHEALAAGCNDFITKPVSFPWLETKVREWGCMQALIDFDGWRKWKDFSQETERDEAAKKAANAKAKAKKNRAPYATSTT
ncbi:hypothetical protein jhhlp_000567 [Lomentospora prolificans]|uniref:Response regulatory domain-containing protein n=1 Tax=Lomentospora prolificans TaxID=41688 RepID=A0A2N3NLE8_9PEZI|nr:hypothetical protein jhhlp_000567 [Lomentospora prolificans]